MPMNELPRPGGRTVLWSRPVPIILAFMGRFGAVRDGMVEAPGTLPSGRRHQQWEGRAG